VGEGGGSAVTQAAAVCSHAAAAAFDRFLVAQQSQGVGCLLLGFIAALGSGSDCVAL
jgi:hypothetical protein